MQGVSYSWKLGVSPESEGRGMTSKIRNVVKLSSYFDFNKANRAVLDKKT